MGAKRKYSKRQCYLAGDTLLGGIVNVFKKMESGEELKKI
jgi:hypothetical protein